ncbi:ribonuclease Z [Sulfurovum lithotrophicum]|uniref:Ribonuclease Z n=1 Tax=Sulfurovum lithotrophicum TaxID=206403 RepID=A0A7U4M0X5_9BACT|nr:MBL fold metallo-hydrolase [Sulfurovum lithotrophicum]AKF24804.1 ribonuclease Z [Sulfurovum lithotrophicum]
MKLTFLGTSAGKPTTERNVSALGLEFDQDNKWYLFDCGEATQHQIMRSSLRVGKLGTIFITHLHGDHYYGLLGLLSSKKLDKAFNPLTIYGPKGIRTFIGCAFADLSFEHLGYHLKIIEYEAGETFIFDRFTVKVLPLVHSVESVAFYIKENNTSNRLNEAKLRAEGLEPSPLYGELKRGKSIVFQGKKLEPEAFMLDPVQGRSLIIAGDNSRPSVLGNYLDNLDLLVHECTYTQGIYDHLPEKVLHTTAKDLGEAAEEKGVKNLIATHINPRYSKNSKLGIEMIYNEIREGYSGRLFIANDFDVYMVGKDRVVRKV